MADSTKKKQKRSVPAGQLHVQATFNNTIVSFSDKKVMFFHRAVPVRLASVEVKGTAYAAQVAAEKAAETAKGYGLKSVDVFVKGVGQGRDAAVRALNGFDINIESIKEVTGVPHGGVRPRKARRG